MKPIAFSTIFTSVIMAVTYKYWYMLPSFATAKKVALIFIGGVLAFYAIKILWSCEDTRRQEVTYIGRRGR